MARTSQVRSHNRADDSGRADADAGVTGVIVTNPLWNGIQLKCHVDAGSGLYAAAGGFDRLVEGRGNGVDSAGGNNAYAVQNVGFTPGIVGQAFSNSPYSYPYGTYNGVRIADQPALSR